MNRPKKLPGSTYQFITGCGPIYVTINSDGDNLSELFITIGKAGGCAASQSQAIGRLISLSQKYSVPIEEIIKQLQGISCHSPAGFGDGKILSCADAISKALKEELNVS